MATEREYTVKAGDTWDSIAARELGNRTLATELAGWNGANDLAAPAVGSKIRILGAGGKETGSTDTAPAADRPSESPRPPSNALSDAERAELEELRAAQARSRSGSGSGSGDTSGSTGGPGPGH